MTVEARSPPGMTALLGFGRLELPSLSVAMEKLRVAKVSGSSADGREIQLSSGTARSTRPCSSGDRIAGEEPCISHITTSSLSIKMAERRARSCG